MPIHELYGMSESTGLCTYNMPDNVKHGARATARRRRPARHAPHTAAMRCPAMGRAGSVGRVLPGVELLIAHPDADGAGELCMRGRNVFMGYYKEPEKTAGVCCRVPRLQPARAPLMGWRGWHCRGGRRGWLAALRGPVLHG